MSLEEFVQGLNGEAKPCSVSSGTPKKGSNKKRAKHLASGVRIAQIRSALDGGATSVKEISEIIGLSEKRISEYSSGAGITLSPCLKQNRDKARYAGHNPSESTIHMRRRPEIDNLVLQGLNFKEIGDAVGLSKQYIQQYIQSTGQYPLYWAVKEKCEKSKFFCSTRGKKFQFKNLLGVLVGVLAQKCKDVDDRAGAEAADYYYSKRCRRYDEIPFETVYSLFKGYFAAKAAGVKFSVGEIGKNLGISRTSVGHILCEAGLDLMYRKLAKHRTPAWKIEAIKRSGVLTDFSNAEVEYFLNVPRWVVLKHRSVERTKKESRGKIRGYIRLSQIYEAVDAGFNASEISELLDLSVNNVKPIMDKRSVLEQKIICALNVLYPEEKHSKPYLHLPR